MLFLRKCKQTKGSERKAEVLQTEELEPLQKSWNAERLRQGDMVGDRDESDPLHPNAWSFEQVMAATRYAATWRCVCIDWEKGAGSHTVHSCFADTWNI